MDNAFAVGHQGFTIVDENPVISMIFTDFLDLLMDNPTHRLKRPLARAQP
jgi:hypothetical protein